MNALIEKIINSKNYKMKSNFLVLFCLIPCFLFAQSENFKDSIWLSNTNKNQYIFLKNNQDSVLQETERCKWLQPAWKKHNHIIDFRSNFGFVWINLHSAGALGYRYYYATDWSYNVKFGLRTGVWYSKTGEDIPKNMARVNMTYTTSFLLNAPIYKSIDWNFSFTYGNYNSWSTKENIYDVERFHKGSSYYIFQLGVNSILFKHLFLEVNYNLINDALAKLWLSSTSFTIGYKF